MIERAKLPPAGISPIPKKAIDRFTWTDDDKAAIKDSQRVATAGELADIIAAAILQVRDEGGS